MPASAPCTSATFIHNKDVRECESAHIAIVWSILGRKMIVDSAAWGAVGWYILVLCA